MRREDLYLYDIVEAADAIGRFIAGSSSSEFADDDLTSSAALQKLSVIGEAAARGAQPSPLIPPTQDTALKTVHR